jgi:hypothetical protein
LGDFWQKLGDIFIFSSGNTAYEFRKKKQIMQKLVLMLLLFFAFLFFVFAVLVFAVVVAFAVTFRR